MRAPDGLRRSRRLLALAYAVACGGADAAPEAAKAPARAGEVWAVDDAGDRADSPAAMLAFAHGLHAIVLDGDDVYAGMTRLRVAGDGGDRRIALGAGGEAVLVRAGDSLSLRFPSGETIALQRDTIQRRDR